MEPERLAEELLSLFSKKGYQWKVGGELILPEKEDFELTIKSVKDLLGNEPDGTRLEVGRLIFQKTGDKLDVYVLQGTIQYDSEGHVVSEKSDNQGDAKK
jgi:hypothetical protein